MDDADAKLVSDAARRWVVGMVVGLNLCPFARRVSDADGIRYAVTDAAEEPELLAALEVELKVMVASQRSTVETTLLIHPHALADFDDYLGFLSEADRLVSRLGLRGTVQIAGFHPAYQFEGTDPDAPENYTNRSPHPMLHLLREDSVSEVADDPAALAAIPRRNIDTLRALGRSAILGRLKAVQQEG